ncbi:hypothetical protein PR048_010095 [Dryococelus australis]|uniref:Uncharacterized protein n=1 Tax=Dryococelus australis TaxID=614101 RepID=A0ABQ9I2I6_9NEOP|nr:hypothetical protein PR048_010095 [Dryococelus australis]
MSGRAPPILCSPVPAVIASRFSLAINQKYRPRPSTPCLARPHGPFVITRRGRSLSRHGAWESCRTITLVSGVSRGSPASPAFYFRRCSTLILITLIGSQDLAVKSCPNLFTHSGSILCLLHRNRVPQPARCIVRTIVSLPTAAPNLAATVICIKIGAGLFGERNALPFFCPMLTFLATLTACYTMSKGRRQIAERTPPLNAVQAPENAGVLPHYATARLWTRRYSLAVVLLAGPMPALRDVQPIRIYACARRATVENPRLR